MMSPAGFEHGRVASNIQFHLDSFVRQHGLGIAPTAEPGFLIQRDPDTVRVPDVAFVCKERLPSTRESGYFPGAPDLAVEVLSPNDLASEVLQKVQNWLDAGCRAVWIVDPARHVVAVYRPRAPLLQLTERDTLTADEILPGFRLPVAQVFA
jgi:Uma2 family endonuclease